MSNKSILQLNNETLASILSNVLGLPSQESLKHWAYVWKKYTLTYSEVKTANAGEETIPDIGSLHTAIKVYMSKSYTFDEATGMFTLVNPTTTTVAYGRSYVFDGQYYFMVNGSAGDKMFESAGISSSSHQTKIYNLNGRVYLKASSTSYAFYVYSNTANKADFVDFVVSDSPTAYPDVGVQDGYWYEKVVEGLQGEYYEVIPTSDTTTITISHTLGVTPSKILVISKTLPTLTYSTQGIFAPIFGDNSGKKGAILVNFYTTGNYPQAKIGDLSTAVELSDKSVILHSYSSSYLFQSGITYEVYILA